MCKSVSISTAKGGGNWKPLSARTIKGRRKGSGKGKLKGTGNRNVAILRDTGTLFNALDPVGNRPGSLEKETKFGILVGFGGTKSHKKAKGRTIASIAEIHQEGKGKIPKREIIVDPSLSVLTAMKKDAERAVADGYN